MSRSRSFDRNAIEDAANAQGGLVTYRQLIDLGMPGSSISRWTRTGGVWQRVLPGTYLLHRGTPTFDERLNAGLLYAGPDALLTGAVVLHLSGLRYAPGRREEELVHLLVPMSRHVKSSSFVVSERTVRMPRAKTVGGYPTAPLPRAVFDAARRLPQRSKVRAFLLEAVQRKLLTVDDLWTEINHGQRRWTAVLREVIGDARSGVRSIQEARLRDAIVRSDLPEPLWNPRLETPAGEFIAEPDGYYDDIGLALELDSREHHFLKSDQFERTWTRHSVYNRHGILAERIVPSLLNAHPAEVVANIRAVRTVYAGRMAPDVVVTPSTSVRGRARR
jgi:hypothetical protein